MKSVGYSTSNYPLERPHAVTSDTLTTAGAVGAIASPVWLPTLYAASHVAGLLLPILGVLWLLVQIGVKLHSTYKRRNDVRKD